MARKCEGRVGPVGKNDKREAFSKENGLPFVFLEAAERMEMEAKEEGKKRIGKRYVSSERTRAAYDSGQDPGPEGADRRGLQRLQGIVKTNGWLSFACQ